MMNKTKLTPPFANKWLGKIYNNDYNEGLSIGFRHYTSNANTYTGLKYDENFEPTGETIDLVEVFTDCTIRIGLSKEHKEVTQISIHKSNLPWSMTKEDYDKIIDPDDDGMFEVNDGVIGYIKHTPYDKLDGDIILKMIDKM